MKTLYAAASAAALALCLSSGAYAVDVRNPALGDDMDNITLTITENGQSRTVTLMDGETIYNICNACTISANGGKEVSASQHDMVEVRGASAQVFKYPATAGVTVRDPSTGDDMSDTRLTVTENGLTRTVTLMSGETIHNLCTDCTIQPEGGKAVQAARNDTVEISGSSARVFKSPTATQQAMLPVSDDTSAVDADALAAPDSGLEGEDN